MNLNSDLKSISRTIGSQNIVIFSISLTKFYDITILNPQQLYPDRTASPALSNWVIKSNKESFFF